MRIKTLANPKVPAVGSPEWVWNRLPALVNAKYMR
jgi:hypothetical protein